MDFKDLPKVELHRHLELSLRPATLRELAPQFGIDIKDDKDFMNRFIISEPMKDLGTVLNKFLDTQKLLATEEILERITYETCQEAFAEGIRIMELRYAPTFVIDGHPELDFEKIHLAIVKGKNRAEADFKMAVGLICIIQRISTVKEAERVTEFAIDHKDTFVGLDLADNEEGFDSKPFSSFFLKAKKAGLGITVHSGEANLEKAPKYVMDAINYLGAERIGHGVQIYKDPKVMQQLIDQKICLELCPTSNWLTQAIPDRYKHPIRQLFDAGLDISINTDDPGIFDVTLTHELAWVSEHYGFTYAEHIQCQTTAAKASFISRDLKEKVWSFND